ncbi:MAG: putative flagellar M-ring protein, partial [Pseudomonadota bacterium]
MNNFREFVLKLWSQLTAFWASQSATRKITFGVVAGGMLAAVITLLAVNREDPYEYVFTDLAAEDSQQIVDYFKRNGVADFVVDSKGIKVPKDRVLALRLQLSQEGLPAHG